MAVKKRAIKVPHSKAVSDRLARELADRPYGQDTFTTRATVSLPCNLHKQAEDLAWANKQANAEPKSVSAIVQNALRLYFKTREELRDAD